jgi:hypothetical protein
MRKIRNRMKNEKRISQKIAKSAKGGGPRGGLSQTGTVPTSEALELRCEDGLRLEAREFVSALPGAKASDVIMYAPGGTHQITPAAGEGAVEMTVAVDATTALVLNASLAAMNARLAPQKCFIDKEHEGKEATAWPKEFFWSEISPDGARAPGVYCRCDLTALGRELIDGKVFRAFSPSFTTDSGLKRGEVKRGQVLKISAGKRGSAENPARITSVVAPDIGTLTNLPAFKEILPLFASDRNGARSGDNKKTASGAAARESGKTGNMKKTDQELLTLRARKSELEQTIPTLKAKDLTDAEAMGAVQNAENELNSIAATLQAHDMAVKNEQLEQALTMQREKDASAAVAAAVKRGAIPAKNLELQAHWKKLLMEDPSNLVILQATASAPALQNSGGIGNQPRIIISGNGAQELRASNRDVLRRYLALMDDKEPQGRRDAAALFASEIRTRLKEGDDIPLRAADVTDASLGTLAGTLVTQQVLDLAMLQLDGVMQLITTDMSDAASDFNGTTITRIVTVPAVETYDAVNGWVQNTPAQTTDVPVTLDKHRGVPIAFNANILASTARRLFDEFAPAASYALVKDAIDELYKVIIVGNFANPAARVVAPIDFGRGTFGDQGEIFNPLGMPMQNRFALLNSTYWNRLTQDPTITQLGVFQQSQQGVITRGEVPTINNFVPREAPNLPLTSNKGAFFGHKSSLLIKSRVPNDYTTILPGGAAHGLVRIVTNSQTGMSAMVVWFADHDKGLAKFRIAWMFGVAKGNTTFGQIIKSA